MSFLESYVGLPDNKPRTAKAIELLTKKGELNEELRKFFMPYSNRVDDLATLLEVWRQLDEPSLETKFREHAQYEMVEALFRTLASVFWENLIKYFNIVFDNLDCCLFISDTVYDTVDSGFMYTYVAGEDTYIGEDYSCFDIIGWEALRYNENGEIDSYENSTDRIVQRGEFKLLERGSGMRINDLIPKNGKTYLVMAVEDEYLLQRVDPVTGWDLGEDE